MEDLEEGATSDLIKDGRSWWSQWFTEIRRWKEEDVDKERATWLRVYGIPCHAWNFEFFEMIANMVGKYVCCNDNTLKGEHMDIARILVRTTCASMMNESFSVHINGVILRIKMTEDSHGLLRINLTQAVKKMDETYSDSDSEFMLKNAVPHGRGGVFGHIKFFRRVFG